MSERANWAGNVVFGAGRVHAPASVGGLQRLVAASPRIRALGTRHSFSAVAVADTDGGLVSVAGLPAVVELDSQHGTARVSAAMTYAGLAPLLDARGFAVANMASLPHISVAGACATGTHGSGLALGSLASAVCAVEMVTAPGDVVTLSRDDDPAVFHGAVVALGTLGVVVRLSLDLVPAFEVSQHVYEDLPREQVDEHLAGILSAGYSVSLFTDWASSGSAGARIRQAWVKQRISPGAGRSPRRPAAPPAQWHGGHLASRPCHPVPGRPAEYTTEQLGIAGPWHERLPHFRPEFTPSAGAELQSEYLLPLTSARAAMRALDEISDLIAPLLQISEIRAVAADELWLSPSYQRDTVAIHFTWKDDARAVTGVLPAVERQLAPFQPRPHWGKLFTMAPQVVRDLYPRLADFQRLARHFDPAGKFGNPFTAAYLMR
jgi:alditol oxidase